jgi:hypothetical protein
MQRQQLKRPLLSIRWFALWNMANEKVIAIFLIECLVCDKHHHHHHHLILWQTSL